jgi:mono/diheme cytochrome c family protein
MRRMFIIVGALALTVIGLTRAQSSKPAEKGNISKDAAAVQHGKYIVHHVAMCIECHTPRDERGDLVMGRLLRGARMPVSSPFPRKVWCFETPQIAGLPGWSDPEAVRFLMTGQDYRGYTPRPPMPPFRMSRQDAEAVVAYLRTLR